MQVVDKYRELAVQLEAPMPLPGAKGRYYVPYTAAGELTPWAAKSRHVAAGRIEGEKVGEKAAGALASKVPFGGLAGGLLKKKSKEVAATAILGGTDFIKKNTGPSFANLNDYAVYLHVKHSGSANYQQALAAAMILHPELEGSIDGAIQHAYRTQAAKAGKKSG